MAAVTVTSGQLMLAASCGIAGVLAAFAPAVHVISDTMSKKRQEHDDFSVWSLFLKITIYQFVITTLFYWAIRILDGLNKFAGMSLMGKDGAFALFWSVNTTYSTTELESWSTVIVFIREIVQTMNAFIPAFFVVGGVIIGYLTADRVNSANKTNDDYLSYGIRIFIAVFISMIAYNTWAEMASYTMMIPSAIDGKPTMLIDAARHWWRVGMGISAGGLSATIN